MITILMGASASGKNYIEAKLVEDYGYNRIVSTTTRPMRDGEKNGREYFFVPKQAFLDMIEEDDLIEYREYHTTVEGIADTWYYGLTKDLYFSDVNYVVILDVQGTRDFIKYVGKDNVKVYYIYCEDYVRTERAMSRGSFDLTEWNRRLEDDVKVFSEENMIDIDYKIVINEGRDINDVIGEIL